MERIVIIDHDDHRLFVEDINEEILQRDYNGEEEAYIKDNYDMENFSWDYITEALYLPEHDDILTINFDLIQ